MSVHLAHEKRWLLAGFIALSIVTGTAAGVMQLLLPLYALSLKISDGGIGLLRGVAQIGGLLMTLPGGFFIDRYGVWRIYVLCCLGNVLAILLIPSAATLPALVLCLFVECSFSTLRWTAINTAFFEELEHFGQGKAAWARGAVAIGLNFFGPLLGGQLARLTNFRWSYAWTGLLVLLPALLLLFFRRKRVAAPLLLSRERPLPLTQQCKELFANRQVMQIALLQSVGIGINSAYLVYIVLLAIKSLHASPQLASQLMAYQGIAFVLTMFCGGRLLARDNLSRIYAGAFLLEALGLLTSGLASALWLVAGGALAMGGGTGLITMLNFSRLGRMAGKKGKIAGLFFLITGTGVAVGPLWAGFFSQLFGIRAAFLGMLPLALAAIGYVTFRSRESGLLPQLRSGEPLPEMGDS